MTNLCRRGCAVALIGLVVTISPLSSGHLLGQSSPVPPPIEELLQRYTDGDVAFVTGQLLLLTDFRAALKQLDRTALPWIRAAGAEAMPRRRLIVAGFALEAAHAGFTKWSTSRDFIEWGCALFRSGGLPQPDELAWHLAAVSLAEGAHDPDLLVSPSDPRAGGPRVVDHLRHSTFRFPDEDRFHLARLVTEEFRTLGSDPKHPQPGSEEAAQHLLKGPFVPPATTPQEIFEPEVAEKIVSRAKAARTIVPFAARRSMWLWQLAANYHTLAKTGKVRSEALVRLAYTYLRLARPAAALDALETVGPSTEDAFLGYLTHYLRGRAFEVGGDRTKAAASYRAALRVAPGAQSASTALAVLLFRSDQRGEAFQIMQAAVSVPAPAADPWRDYQSSDFRLWPERIAGLRARYR